jgi:nitrite reductase/ring-hydroxylating ferredoxin subunit
MLGRAMTRLVDAQSRWAQPLGERLVAIISPVFARLPSIKDLLNGTWLGHPLHATLTDVPIGALTLMVVLDLVRQDGAADIALSIGIVTMIAAAFSGSADYVDTHGRSRTVATVHASVMIAALLVLLVSLGLRLAGDDLRPLGIVVGLAGYLVLLAGAFAGGEIVFSHGYPVDRHAWRSPPREWRRLDVDDVPAGRPVAAKVGSESIVLVRQGDAIHALAAVCAHAGGPLAEGSIEDGCVVCPWHGSSFDLTTGERRRGPSVYDQPRFEVRRGAEGGFEARAVRDGD